jgi:cobalt/nickel transport system permease protein
MGVIPCLIMYPLVFKPLLKKGADAKRLSVASIISVVVGLEIGAFCVVLETLFSGITALPVGTFAALMLPIHLAIGVVEGIVTAAILIFVRQSRPEIIDSALGNERIDGGVSLKKVLIPLAVLTVIVGGALSLFASANPDGLEWAIGNIVGETELETDGGIYDSTAAAQEGTAFLPDYAFASDPDNAAGTSVSGIVGAVITFVLAGVTGLVISIVKKSKKATT